MVSKQNIKKLYKFRHISVYCVLSKMKFCVRHKSMQMRVSNSKVILFCLIPLSVSGSHDMTLIVWSKTNWHCQQVLEGHQGMLYTIIATVYRKDFENS